MQNLHRFLDENESTLFELRADLRRAGPFEARALLQNILRTQSNKIIDCYLRDFVRVDAFPVDRRVERTLEAFGLVADGLAMVALCRRNKIDPRVMARAVYWNADTLEAKARQRKPR